MASPIQIVLNPENYEEARDAGGGQVLAAQLQDGASHVGGVERIERPAASEPDQRGEVASVGGYRMRRQPPFGGEMLQVMRHRGRKCGRRSVRRGHGGGDGFHPWMRTSAAPTSWLRRSR